MKRLIAWMFCLLMAAPLWAHTPMGSAKPGDGNFRPLPQRGTPHDAGF